MVWNIPGRREALPEGVPQGATAARRLAPDQRDRPVLPRPGGAGVRARRITTCSSSTRSTRSIDVPAVGASPAQTRAAVVAAMAGHVRGKGVYTGLFKRTP